MYSGLKVSPRCSVNFPGKETKHANRKKLNSPSFPICIHVCWKHIICSNNVFVFSYTNIAAHIEVMALLRYQKPLLEWNLIMHQNANIAQSKISLGSTNIWNRLPLLLYHLLLLFYLLWYRAMLLNPKMKIWVGHLSIVAQVYDLDILIACWLTHLFKARHLF